MKANKQVRVRSNWLMRLPVTSRISLIASLIMIFSFFMIAIIPGPFAGLFGSGDPRFCDLSRAGMSSVSGHPFGFDMQGCDLFSNVIYGARASITVGVLVTFLSLVVAVILGALAGFYGGLVDTIISRTTDIFMGFPFLLGALVVLIVIPSGSIWTVSLTLALFSWPMLTRVMRASVITQRGLDYVLAARALGAGPVRMMLRHLIPNAIRPVIVLATLMVGTVIVAESSLTYLGLGLQSPAISWGAQLSNAQNDFGRFPHLLIFPGTFLVVAVLSFVMLGESIRRIVDPKE